MKWPSEVPSNARKQSGSKRGNCRYCRPCKNGRFCWVISEVDGSRAAIIILNERENPVERGVCERAWERGEGRAHECGLSFSRFLLQFL
jgi:hypothetical protein